MQQQPDDLIARAGAGDLAARVELGHRYALGLGDAHDEAEARRWYRLAEAARWALAAAAAGHGPAAMYAGRLHQAGTHVPRDLEAATRLYREAIARGVGHARAGLLTAGADRALPRWKAWMATLYAGALGSLALLVILPCRELGAATGGALLGAATGFTIAIVALFALVVRAGVRELRA